MNLAHALPGLCGLVLSVAASAVAEPASLLDLHFKLVDADNRPVAQAPVRLVLTTLPGWQAALAGQRFTTDDAGEVRWSAPAALETRRRKVPTNFFTQALSPDQETVHLALAAELPYLGLPWLVVSEVDRFADGTHAQLDGMRVYGRDAAGAFTAPATVKEGVWRLPGVRWPLTTPGHQVVSFTLQPRASGWSATLVMKRLAEPAIR